MAITSSGTVVGLFTSHDEARAAVSELRDRGFPVEQVGVAGRGVENDSDLDDDSPTYVAEGAATGVATGAGIGALWGLGIIAGVLPVLGPAIAGGTLAAILTSAAAGATVAGFTGTLIGMGIPKDEADYYESELNAGRVVVTVTAPGREAEAFSVMQRHGAFDRSTAQLADRR